MAIPVFLCSRCGRALTVISHPPLTSYSCQHCSPGDYENSSCSDSWPTDDAAQG